MFIAANETKHNTKPDKFKIADKFNGHKMPEMNNNTQSSWLDSDFVFLLLLFIQFRFFSWGTHSYTLQFTSNSSILIMWC